MDILKRAAELLKGVQWQYRPYDDHWHTESSYYCPECDGKKENGHTSKCALLAVITELERAQSSPVNQQMLEALKELRDAYQEFMGVPAVKANAAIAAAEASGQENNQAEPVVPPRDMPMRVAESVRAACFDACNENGGDWAAIHSLDLAEIIGELGATDAAGQANKQPEPGTVPYCLRILIEQAADKLESSDYGLAHDLRAMLAAAPEQEGGAA
ncbi:hypothetical protein [Laribacter hongkongensis]|uniref:hypothetical protein n=1 Tax=Laribacter hongkongensis TaxID=168471 RepID=UPI001EFD02B6|nr:hypothetical protein [Laribacter hongkongensis]MCG9077631.1 hypothetical protein [Laribacter hongkongensis]